MDTGFRHEQALSSALNRHTISFQSSSASGMVFSGSSCGSESAQGLKHHAGLAVEWSIDEQYKLEEALSKYGDEPNILRYIKIAATLRDKTVRDVALRCRWTTRKRRKKDELKLGKKLKDNKDRLVESSLSSHSALNVAPFSFTMNSRVQQDDTAFERVRNLLEQNNIVLGRISANISSFKLQDNVDLFSHAKNNLTAILNDLRYMPGPLLPVSVNEDLANTILPTISRTMMRGMHLKQEQDY